MAIKTTVVCPQCGGDGKIDLWENDEVIGDQDCPLCSATGRYTTALFGGDNLFFTYQISDATVTSEYNALTSTQKSTYKTIVSMGVVDLSDGTSTKTKLWNMFGEGTTTRANLESLIAS